MSPETHTIDSPWFLLPLAIFIIGGGLLALFFPWRFHTPLRRVLLHLPVLCAVAIYPYNKFMPTEWNIRIDLLLIYPLVGIALICYFVKLATYSKRKLPPKS